jgi:anti-sigma B factor antagonist
MAVSMCGVDLSTREGGGHVVVVLCGELDMAAAAGVAAALAAAAARQPHVNVDLAGVRFIDASGVAALVRGRNQARHAGGELLLAAPGHRVLRVLALTRLIGVFPVHASVDEAARSAGYSRRAAVPAARPPVLAAIRDPGPVPRAGR